MAMIPDFDYLYKSTTLCPFFINNDDVVLLIGDVKVGKTTFLARFRIMIIMIIIG